MADSFIWDCSALWDKMDLLTKSSSEKLSKFLCPDYDGITEKHPHFKTFVEYIFRKPTLSTAPKCPEVGYDFVLGIMKIG